MRLKISSSSSSLVIDSCIDWDMYKVKKVPKTKT